MLGPDGRNTVHGPEYRKLRHVPRVIHEVTVALDRLCDNASLGARERVLEAFGMGMACDDGVLPQLRGLKASADNCVRTRNTLDLAEN